MPNHVHFIAIPQQKYSLAKTFNACHMRYSQYYNKKKNKKGHLWQGRFYSCALYAKHLYEAVRYVENNPVRAKIVKKAEQWESLADLLLEYDLIAPLDVESAFTNQLLDAVYED